MRRALWRAALLLVGAAWLIGGQDVAVRAQAVLTLQGIAAPVRAAAGGSPAVAVPAEGGTAVAAPADGTAASQTPEAAAAQQAKTARMQKLQQVTFDRRASAILKAWSGLDAQAETDMDTPKQPTAPGQPAETAATPTPEQLAAEQIRAFEEAVKQWQRAVTLGNWAEVKAFLATLEDDEAQAAYRQMLSSLQGGPQGAPQAINQQLINQIMLSGANPATLLTQLAASGMGPGARFVEQNLFTPADVVGLIAAAPIPREATKPESAAEEAPPEAPMDGAPAEEAPPEKGANEAVTDAAPADKRATEPTPLDKAALASLGAILRSVLQRGHQSQEVVALLQAARGDDGGERPLLTQRQLTKLLFAAGLGLEVGPLLPTLEQAQGENDREGLNLLSRHLLALYDRDKKVEQLESAWTAIQAALATGDIDVEAKEEALRRAVEIAPRIREELGQAWLDESFTARAERGKEILATIGATAAANPQSRPGDPATRLKELQLQQTAVEALLKASPDQAQEWRTALSVLASNWLREAELSQQYDRSTAYGPRMRRDMYGNYYYYQDEDATTMQFAQQQGFQAIGTADVLEARPGDAWLALVDESQRPEFWAKTAQLFLKVQEESQAFPYIERLAATHPQRAHSLCEEFLRVWTKNHNPNDVRERTNFYMWSWGYEQRAESIPLTRSKQQRNLEELSDWIARLRALPVEQVDEQLLARAFTVCHSEAEVYRLEAIEQVFGSLDGLKPATLAELIQTMRANLATVWKKPDVQKKAGTRRREKDIQVEVLRGFDVARQVLDAALAKHPDDWSLHLAMASVMHDEAIYRNDLQKSTEFTPHRRAALERFARAAELYAKDAATRSEDDETVNVYQTWFYASLGAVDLAMVKPESVADLSQPARIREAILALPGESADRHLAKFANDMFTRLSAVNAEMKFRFLRGGFEIVGDHKQAHEARKVFDYYQDLVTEIKLAVRVDGPDTVGHGQPFGVFVDLQHTKEIERESGGFGKYLQNQNNMYFSYNYGRPTENYRDKFQEGIATALADQFEVLSVTFNDPDTHSKSLPEYGWRVTPYAYLLLKAKGPEVDRLPPLKIDLDFLDTSGYVILPIESAALPLDASGATPPARPVGKLDLAETLDERQSRDGKLILELKATSRGLVPELDALVDKQVPGFEIAAIDDQGLSVTQFDQESDETTIVSERLWTITYTADKKLAEPPTSYAFPECLLTEATVTRQRYDDADMIAAESVVALNSRYGTRSYAWAGWLSAAALALLVGGVLVARRLRRAAPSAEARFIMPEPVTAFTVLGLLKDIQHNNGLNEAGHRELASTIDGLEQHYFREPGDQAPVDREPDLTGIARSWVQRCG